MIVNRILGAGGSNSYSQTLRYKHLLNMDTLLLQTVFLVPGESIWPSYFLWSQLDPLLNRDSFYAPLVLILIGLD